MINLKIYKYILVNLNKVNMSKENKKTVSNELTPFESFTNNNGNLKRYLGLALKNTSQVMKVLLPKIAVEVKNMISFHLDKTKDQTETDQKKSVINEKAIREHLYKVVEYNRKEEENGAFEIVVYRAIKLGKMLVDYPKQFNVDEKENKIYVMSKVATPMILEKLEGQKNSSQKKPNNSETLVEVNTGTIDRVYKVKYGGGSSGGTTKDDKMIVNNFKTVSKEFYKKLDKFLTYAKNKDVRFFNDSDEELWKYLSNTFTLFNSPAYQNARNFSEEYEQDITGEKAIKKEIKKIA